MRYRVVYTLVAGFALLAGRASVGQVPTTPESGGLVGQTNPATQAAASAGQPANTSDSTAAAHWWQRFAPPAGANEKAAKPVAAAAVPTNQTAPTAAPSSWYFGKLLNGNETKVEQTDPFAVKAASYEERVSTPAVVVADSAAPNKTPITSPPSVANIASMAPTGGLFAATTPSSGAINDGVVPISAAPNGCPYPDTGIQALYQPVPSAPGALITDRPTSSAQPQSAENVRGAFNGLLGRDDVRTKQEAAALPLLAPYRDLPVGFPHTATAVPSVKPRAPGSPSNGTKVAAQAEKGAPASTDAQSDRYAKKPASDSKEKAIVDAAFNLPTTETKSQATTVQASGTAPVATAASNQSTSPQPLQLNGVVAQQLTGTPLNRPKIIYHPGASVVDNAGRKLMKPDVQVAADSTSSSIPTSVQLAQFAADNDGTLPAPANIAPETAYPIDDQQWMPSMSGFDDGTCNDCQRNGHGLFKHGCDDGCCGGRGIGAEYVAQAPFFIQTTQPFNNCYVRLDLARDLEFPDRSEYFWAKTPDGKGPQPTFIGERSVNYQDLNFYIEKGTKRLSIGTNLPIRAVDPELRNDSVGFGDMSVKTKAVLIDGTCWQLTQLFNTYLPTGTAHHGTGNGHVSLEPGVAYRWKWSDITYFHGDLKYLFPISADPDFSGQIFNYGFGWSHVLHETDTYALIPVFEVECWTFVDGRQTLPNAPVPVIPAGSEEINTIGVMNICPGLRWVCDKGCDCGTKEFGISAGVSVTNEHLYDQILRLEFRWSR